MASKQAITDLRNSLTTAHSDISSTIRAAQIEFLHNKTGTLDASASGSIVSSREELDLTTLQYTAEHDRATEKG